MVDYTNSVYSVYIHEHIQRANLYSVDILISQPRHGACTGAIPEYETSLDRGCCQATRPIFPLGTLLSRFVLSLLLQLFKMTRKAGPKSVKWEDVVVKPRAGKANPEVNCRYCSTVWYNNSVMRVDNHMAECPNLPIDLYPRYGRRQPGESRPRKRPRQGTLDQETYTMSSIDQQACDELLAEAIYSSGVPFSFVSFYGDCSEVY